MKISLWNFHMWFKQKGILHDMHIVAESNAIIGVRTETLEEDSRNFAVVCDTRNITNFQEYPVVIFHENSYLLFKNISVQCILSEANNMMFRFQNWERELKKINVENGSIHQLLEIIEDIFPHPLILTDGLNLISYSPDYSEKVQALWEKFQMSNIEKEFNTSFEYTKLQQIYNHREAVIIRSSDFPNQTVIVSNIWIEGKCSAKLIAFSDEDSFTQGDVQVMNELSAAVSLNLKKGFTKHLKGNEAEFIIEKIIRNNQLDKSEIIHVLGILQWKETDKFIVFYIEPEKYASSFVLKKMVKKIKRDKKNICTFYMESVIVVICNVQNYSEIQEKDDILECLKEERYFVGCSYVGNEFTELSQYARQAQRALEKARIRNINFLDMEDAAQEFIEEEIYSNHWLQSLVVPEVRRLEQEDKKRGSILSNTLYCYLTTGGNGVATAKQLNIHRTTLNYRLEHIRNIVGDKLDDVKGKELLMLSLVVSLNTIAGKNKSKIENFSQDFFQ